MAAGFVDFEITWQADVFSGAPQASSAAEFGTQGINCRARKAAHEQEWHAARASLACEVPLKPTALLGADAFSARLYPYYAAKASVSVSRSNNARGICTISGCAGDIQESVTGQSCLRTNASGSANVGRASGYQAVL